MENHDHYASVVAGAYLPKQTAEFVEDVILETGRVVVRIDKDGVHGEVAPSKVAPTYLQDIFYNQECPITINPELLSEESHSSSSPFDSSCSLSFEELQNFKKKILNEDRLASMHKLKHNFSSRFDNRAWLHPHGTTNFDYKSIHKHRREALERYKNRVRRDNYAYLGSHPEIQALISLLVKKLLTVRPPDATDFMAEYFTTRLALGSADFEKHLETEMKKLSKYHVAKMKNDGKILVRSAGESSRAEGAEWPVEADVNIFKRMNIGPLAADYAFDDPSCLLGDKIKKQEEEKQRKLRRKKKPRKYCGCKDWKLKKNRGHTAESGGGDGGRTLTPPTLSTLGNVNTLQTSEEEEEEEEDDGEFMSKLDELENADDEFTQEDAERVASELVNDFLNPDGQQWSVGATKNIQ